LLISLVADYLDRIIHLTRNYLPVMRVWIGPFLLIAVTEPEHIEVTSEHGSIVYGWQRRTSGRLPLAGFVVDDAAMWQVFAG
jgi:hypothetical protein